MHKWMAMLMVVGMGMAMSLSADEATAPATDNSMQGMGSLEKMEMPAKTEIPKTEMPVMMEKPMMEKPAVITQPKEIKEVPKVEEMKPMEEVKPMIEQKAIKEPTVMKEANGYEVTIPGKTISASALFPIEPRLVKDDTHLRDVTLYEVDLKKAASDDKEQEQLLGRYLVMYVHNPILHKLPSVTDPEKIIAAFLPKEEEAGELQIKVDKVSVDSKPGLYDWIGRIHYTFQKMTMVTALRIVVTDTGVIIASAQLPDENAKDLCEACKADNFVSSLKLQTEHEATK